MSFVSFCHVSLSLHTSVDDSHPSLLLRFHSYKFDTPFEQEIKKEVFKIVRRGREFGTFGWFFRCFFYIALFFGLQYLWIFSGSTITLAIVYGVSQALIGLNVQHDANHGAISRRPWINRTFAYTQNWIGGSTVSW